HLVDGVGEGRDLALGFEDDFSAQVAIGDRRHDAGDTTHLVSEVAGHQIDAVGQVFPGTGNALDLGLAAQLAFGTDLARDARDFRGESVELVDHAVDRVLQVEDLAADVDGDLLRQVAVGDRGRYLGDVAHVRGEVAGHEIHVVGEVLPDADDAADLRLAAQLAFGTDLARDARDFRGEAVELIDHDVDGVLHLEDLALALDRDLLGEVALLHGRCDLGDVTHLGREIGGELVDLLGEVLPGPGRTRHTGLATEAALGTDLTCHAGDFAGEPIQLIDHAVDRVLQLEDLAANVDGDLLGEVALGDGGGDLGDVAHLGGQVAGHVIDVVGEVFPDAGHAFHLRLAAEVAFGADLAGHPCASRFGTIQLIDHAVDRVLQLEDLAANVDGDFLREVAFGDGGRHVGDIAHLSRQVGGHQVDVVGEVLPDAGRALTCAWPPSLPSVPTSLATRVTSEENERNCWTMALTVRA